jgi:Na+/melibiose symporter-like transporter
MQSTSSLRQKVFYSFGNFGNGVYNGVNNAILGLFISAFTSNPFIIGYVSNTRTVEGAVIQPIVGRLSDRTTSRLGRRRPFMLFGIPLSVFFLALVPVFSHASHGYALPLIVASIILFSITWSIAGDPYQALMIDIVPEAERSKFNAILSVVALVGQVALELYAAIASISKHNIPDQVFYACIAVLFLSYAIVFFGVKEPKEAAAVARREEKIPLRVYIAELREFKETMKLLISIFFFWTGINAVLPFLTVFTKKEMHVSNSKAIIIFVVIIISSAIVAYPSGWLAGRYGKRPLIVLGTALMILAAIGGTLAPTYAWLFPVAILTGIGFAPTTVLTYPYLAELVPARKIGVFTGLQATFASIAVPLSTGITAGLIDLFGYRSIFVMLAVMMVVDIFFLRAIDEAAAAAQVRQVEAIDERIDAAIAVPSVS